MRKIYPSAAGPVEAVRNLTFDVRRGELACIVGPSGAGKTTLLKIISGLLEPTEGEVVLDGKKVTGPPKTMAVVFQEYGRSLFPWLTVRETVCFGLRERGMPPARQQETARYWLDKVGLTGFERHYPKMLSGGMQQRTAIARALANDPKILLLDEPFGALDNQTRSLMQELLLSIWESDRKTVLFVTHDIEEAIFMASRVVVMSARPGRIKADVPVTIPHPRQYTVKTTPEFSALKAQLTEQIRVEALKVAAMAATD